MYKSFMQLIHTRFFMQVEPSEGIDIHFVQPVHTGFEKHSLKEVMHCHQRAEVNLQLVLMKALKSRQIYY